MPAPMAPSRPAQRLRLLLVAGAWAAVLGGGSDSGAKECKLKVKTWWDERYEYFHFENWVLAALMLITTVFEHAWHSITHWVRHRQHAEDEDHEEDADHGSEAKEGHMASEASKASTASQVSTAWRAARMHNEFQHTHQPLYAAILQKAAGELMVLGFLAFVVWICVRLGAFHAMACHIDFSNIKVPNDWHGYLETVEDVHIHLFLSMVVFVAVLGMSAFFMKIRHDKWRRFNRIIIAAHKADEDKYMGDHCPSGEPLSLFLFFARSRHMLFQRLTLATREENAEFRSEAHMLVDLLEELHHETVPHLRFQRNDLSEELEDWFPFDEYERLMCNHLMEDLIEIKPFTWLFTGCGLITCSLVIQATHTGTWQFVIITSQFVLTILFGVWVPTQIMRRGKTTEGRLTPERLVARKRTVEGMDSRSDETHDYHPNLRFPSFIQVEAFPMFSLQLFLLFWCYNVVRLSASMYLWDSHLGLAILFTILLVATIPIFGFLVAFMVSYLALAMGRGDLGLSRYHIAWTYSYAARTLFKDRRAKYRATKRAPTNLHMAALEGNAAGSSSKDPHTASLEVPVTIGKSQM